MLTLRQSRRFLVQAHIRKHVSALTFARPFELSIHGHLSITTHGTRSDNSLSDHLSTLEKRSYVPCLLGNSRTCHSVERSIRVHLSTFTHAHSRAGTRMSDTFQYPPHDRPSSKADILSFRPGCPLLTPLPFDTGARSLSRVIHTCLPYCYQLAVTRDFAHGNHSARTVAVTFAFLHTSRCASPRSITRAHLQRIVIKTAWLFRLQIRRPARASEPSIQNPAITKPVSRLCDPANSR
jgi:hypothetical protein